MLRTTFRSSPYIILFSIIILLPLIGSVWIHSLFWKYNLSTPFSLILFLLSFLFLYIVLFMLESSIIFRLLKGKIREGEYFMDRPNTIVAYWGVSYMLFRICSRLLSILPIPKEIVNLICLKTAGASVGKNCILSGDISDPLIVEIGDNCVIGGNSLILCHSIEGNRLIFKKTKLEDNVTVGANSIVSAGATIGKNTIVGALSFVKKGQTLDPNSIYVGIPSKKVGEISVDYDPQI